MVAFGIKRTKYFLLFGVIFFKFCQNISAKDVWQVAYLKSIFGTTLWQLVFDDGIFTNPDHYDALTEYI